MTEFCRKSYDKMSVFHVCTVSTMRKILCHDFDPIFDVGWHETSARHFAECRMFGSRVIVNSNVKIICNPTARILPVASADMTISFIANVLI